MRPPAWSISPLDSGRGGLSLTFHCLSSFQSWACVSDSGKKTPSSFHFLNLELSGKRPLFCLKPIHLLLTHFLVSTFFPIGRGLTETHQGNVKTRPCACLWQAVSLPAFPLHWSSSQASPDTFIPSILLDRITSLLERVLSLCMTKKDLPLKTRQRLISDVKKNDLRGWSLHWTHNCHQKQGVIWGLDTFLLQP